jgi:gliding motility-associated-like protein
MASDILYNCIDSCNYEVTIRLYRDCDGISAPNSTFTNFSSSCGSFDVSIDRVNVLSGVDVSQVCDQSQDQCNGGTLPGTEIHVYRDTINFCAQTSNPYCNDWTISYSSCCRNSAIDNLDNPGSKSMYFYTTLDNSSGTCSNNSPDFSILPTPYICDGTQFCYNHGAIDPDGDSLVYSVVQPKEDATTNISYSAPYNTSEPLPTGGTFTLDSTTGEMCFTPTSTGQFVIAVKIEQYSGNQKVAETHREMQIIVESCSNSPPQFDSTFNVTNGNQLSSKEFTVCPGDSFSFDMAFSDPDTSDTLRLSTNLSASIPDAYFSQSGTNPIFGQFGWRPGAADTGSHVFIVKVEDSACPIPAINYATFYIDVFRGTQAFPKQSSYCDVGDSIQLQALGGSSFTWSPAAGLSCTNCPDPKAATDTTTDYIVTSSLTSCDNKDTVTVRKVPDIIPTTTPPDTSVCMKDSVQLNTTVDPSNQAPFVYDWTPDDDLTQDSIANPVVSPTESSNYVVKIVSDSNCIVYDTTYVNVHGIEPRASVKPDPLQLCKGDTGQLQLGLTPWVCGPHPAGCADSVREADVGGNNTSTTQTTPYKGGADDNRVQFLYRPGELNAAGITAGTITELAFFVSSANSLANYSGFTIKMGCTSKNQFNSGDDYIEDLDVVYGPTSYNTSSGWNTHTLTTPYNWDGSSSLVIEVCFDNGSNTSSDGVLYSNTGFNSVLQKDAIGASGCNLSNPGVYTERPNTRFDVCDRASPDSLNVLYWSPPAGLSNPGVSDPKVYLDQSQNYDVIVSDSGCSDTATVMVQVVPKPDLSAFTDTFICDDGVMTLRAIPDTSYVYEWSPSVGLSDTVGSSTQVSLSNDGTSPDEYTYIVSATDTLARCRNEDSLSLKVFPDPQLQSQPVDTAVCSGESVNFQATANDSYRYRWQSPSGGIIGGTGKQSIEVRQVNTSNSAESHIYYVQVTDSLGCINSDTSALLVRPIPSIDAGEDTTIRVTHQAYLNASTDWATEFTWTPEYGLSCFGCLQPVASPEQTTQYTVVAADQYGCQSMDSVLVEVIYPPLDMPNAFTPNGDGVNDEIRSRGGNVVEIEYRVFNRWGELMFETNDPDAAWDGTNMNGEPQPAATYVYYINATVIDNETQEKETRSIRGNITLIR